MTPDPMAILLEGVNGPAAMPPMVARSLRLSPMLMELHGVAELTPEGCAWFATCTRPAVLTVDHATLGHVRSCLECLEGVGVEVDAIRSALESLNA